MLTPNSYDCEEPEVLSALLPEEAVAPQWSTVLSALLSEDAVAPPPEPTPLRGTQSSYRYCPSQSRSYPSHQASHIACLTSTIQGLEVRQSGFLAQSELVSQRAAASEAVLRSQLARVTLQREDDLLQGAELQGQLGSLRQAHAALQTRASQQSQQCRRLIRASRKRHAAQVRQCTSHAASLQTQAQASARGYESLSTQLAQSRASCLDLQRQVRRAYQAYDYLADQQHIQTNRAQDYSDLEQRAARFKQKLNTVLRQNAQLRSALKAKNPK